MHVSQQEREELKRRVAGKLARRSPGAQAVSRAVDAVVDRLEGEGEGASPGHDTGPEQIVIVTAESMPDLASRLRGRLPGDWALPWAIARAGRHTVVVARASAVQRDALQAAAEHLGVRITTKEQE